jgi:hypothetical protein
MNRKLRTFGFGTLRTELGAGNAFLEVRTVASACNRSACSRSARGSSDAANASIRAWPRRVTSASAP